MRQAQCAQTTHTWTLAELSGQHTSFLHHTTLLHSAQKQTVHSWRKERAAQEVGWIWPSIENDAAACFRIQWVVIARVQVDDVTTASWHLHSQEGETGEAILK